MTSVSSQNVHENCRISPVGLRHPSEMRRHQPPLRVTLFPVTRGSPADSERTVAEHVEITKTIVVDAVMATETILGAEIIAH